MRPLNSEGGTEITAPFSLPSGDFTIMSSSESMNNLPWVYKLCNSFSLVWSPLRFFDSGSCCVEIRLLSFVCIGSRLWILRHARRCVMGMRDVPALMSSIVNCRISAALSPIPSHSCANAHIWQFLDRHFEGFLDAKSLVCRVLPGWYLSSTDRALSPVRNDEMRELEEKAPRWLLLHAKTQGWESVWWIVTLSDSRM